MYDEVQFSPTVAELNPYHRKILAQESVRKVIEATIKYYDLDRAVRNGILFSVYEY